MQDKTQYSRLKNKIIDLFLLNFSRFIFVYFGLWLTPVNIPVRPLYWKFQSELILYASIGKLKIPRKEILRAKNLRKEFYDEKKN